MTSGARLPYAAAKAGVLGFTYQLAKDLAPTGILVNAIVLGFVLTEPGATARDRYDALSADEQHLTLAPIPLGRPGRLEEVAKVVAFLASEDAGFITGAAIDVSGGR
jgi:NAD(P)-dependent dehydrogenase (short-subunit alcohol dehydrogenase family)